jgi:Flp pilus assembly pilin Flp
MNISRDPVRKIVRLFIRNKRAATMVEYALLLALVLLVAYKSFGTLGSKISAGAAAAHKKL